MPTPGHGDSDSLGISTSTRLQDAALQDPAIDLAAIELNSYLNTHTSYSDALFGTFFLFSFRYVFFCRCVCFMTDDLMSIGAWYS